ncbi:Rho GTPase activation protein [Coemansia reversa NRRL 1564]|uniref:Rho GTPase activation protein n=1 Tax=Coemansia reversa (strain ATCC 12441 / NRRL 1564) TaxID=763665 RepID=A0A2G5BHT4_COERN|nr:Rho GTPase activation protein [Coemansia reversa NRRL 1564]|eukprot:PIA18555.1 Rho GTPase activation protein [Coemansia reversa NRRL 1564]
MPFKSEEAADIGRTKRGGKQQQTKSKSYRHKQQHGSSESREGELNQTTGNCFQRLWHGIRHIRDSNIVSPSIPARPITESGTVVVGDVRNPRIAIPADIMFSPRRAALYSTMASLLVRSPYYISRVIFFLKDHECDGLLTIVLNSLFGEPQHETALIALFTEIIWLEVDRTNSASIVMRNDAPSVHMLSAYLRNKPCLDFLKIAVGPTIETIVDLGNISLDPDIAAAYQDWARTQKGMRMPPVVSVVEAASYTEVQNLSRRRQRYLAHVASHCLFDITSARHHIPSGLLAICSSMLQATRSKFPEADAARGYSLVGGIFFLRFVNAALTTPNHYGLLDTPVTGIVKTNLKLIARLMQRMSNYSAKIPEKWPSDVHNFMKANIAEFHSFLESLTVQPDAMGDICGDDVVIADTRRVQSAGTLAGSVTTVALGALGAKSNRICSDNGRFRSISSAAQCESCGSDFLEDSLLLGKAKHAKASKRVVRHRAQSTPWAELSLWRNEGGSRRANGVSLPLPRVAEQPQQPRERSAKCAASPTSNGTTSSSLGHCSVRSMFDMGKMLLEGSEGGQLRRPGRSGAFGDVFLPLNDLYLLQKYLLMYEDAWASGEAEWYVRNNAKDGVAYAKVQNPMQRCLHDLGPAPALACSLNNHCVHLPID